jgi:hypothetical protein
MIKSFFQKSQKKQSISIPYRPVNIHTYIHTYIANDEYHRASTISIYSKIMSKSKKVEKTVKKNGPKFHGHRGNYHPQFTRTTTPPHIRTLTTARNLGITIPSCQPSGPPVAVTVTNTPSVVNVWIKKHSLLSGDVTAVGLDVEWRPCFVAGAERNRVAVVQLALQSAALVVQVKDMTSLPPSLASLLAFPGCVKVGVGVEGDLMRLQRDFRVPYGGFCDIVSFVSHSHGQDNKLRLTARTVLPL